MVRIKHRYLLVHILNPEPALPKAKTNPTPPEKPLPDLVQFHSPCPNSLTPRLLVAAIKDQVQYLYGDYGLGLVASSLVVKYLSPATSTAIVRVSRDHYRIVWGALAFMTRLPTVLGEKQERGCVMRVVRVSGTIRKAEEEAVRRARAAILKVKREGGDGVVGLLGEDEGVGGLGRREGGVGGEEGGEWEDEEDDDEVGGDEDEVG